MPYQLATPCSVYPTGSGAAFAGGRDADEAGLGADGTRAVLFFFEQAAKKNKEAAIGIATARFITREFISPAFFTPPFYLHLLSHVCKDVQGRFSGKTNSVDTF
jgi:hypothetical protein